MSRPGGHTSAQTGLNVTFPLLGNDFLIKQLTKTAALPSALFFRPGTFVHRRFLFPVFGGRPYRESCHAYLWNWPDSTSPGTGASSFLYDMLNISKVETFSLSDILTCK